MDVGMRLGVILADIINRLGLTQKYLVEEEVQDYISIFRM